MHCTVAALLHRRVSPCRSDGGIHDQSHGQELQIRIIQVGGVACIPALEAETSSLPCLRLSTGGVWGSPIGCCAIRNAVRSDSTTTGRSCGLVSVTYLTYFSFTISSLSSHYPVAPTLTCLSPSPLIPAPPSSLSPFLYFPMFTSLSDFSSSPYLLSSFAEPSQVLCDK